MKSINPVFVNFSLLDDKTDVTLTPVSGDAIEQGNTAPAVMDSFNPGEARYGFPVEEGNTPFHTPYANVPWGKAVLCTAVKTPAEGGANASLGLTAIDGVLGTCYGITVKDCSLQLNCGFSANVSASVEIDTDDANELCIAVIANAKLDTATGEIVAGETVVAVSDAIDPTVLNLGESDGDAHHLVFVIPEATGGFTFTARGTMLKAPFVNHVSNYTSFKDTVTSFPVSQAILDAKTNS